MFNVHTTRTREFYVVVLEMKKNSKTIHSKNLFNFKYFNILLEIHLKQIKFNIYGIFNTEITITYYSDNLQIVYIRRKKSPDIELLYNIYRSN